MATGTIAASYGGCITAVLETWYPVRYDEWAMGSPFPPPDAMTDLDTNVWIADTLPDLGGAAFFYEGEARMAGVRIKPPPQDPHIYHKERQGAKKKGANVDQNRRETSRRRRDRARSAVQFARFSEGRGESPIARGQNTRGNSRRGRGRKRDKTKSS